MIKGNKSAIIFLGAPLARASSLSTSVCVKGTKFSAVITVSYSRIGIGPMIERRSVTTVSVMAITPSNEEPILPSANHAHFCAEVGKSGNQLQSCICHSGFKIENGLGERRCPV